MKGRRLCILRYGERFGEVYDKVAAGQPIGGISETVAAARMVDAVKSTVGGKHARGR